MKQKRLYLTLAVLVLASLACGLGGGNGGSDVSPPSGGDEPAPSSGGSGKYDTEFPVPPKVENFMETGDNAINYQTSMELDDVVAFYRGEFENAGYDERDITTVISDTTFSIVWDGHSSGQAIVVQGVDLGDGNVNVNVRLEDV